MFCPIPCRTSFGQEWVHENRIHQAANVGETRPVAPAFCFIGYRAGRIIVHRNNTCF